ncbi:MAG: DUF3634 family protein [Myxococcaceae bacterium]|nr:DUF3634 family protein [Myxococcaceae bacterium]
MLPVIVVLGAILIISWLVSRAGELFFVSICDGRVLVVRGRIPQGLLNDFADVVRKPPVRRGSIRAVKTIQGGQLIARGVDEFREQRLRNIFRLYPLSNLRAQPPGPDRRTLGQLLGIAWLAWLLDRSGE